MSKANFLQVWYSLNSNSVGKAFPILISAIFPSTLATENNRFFYLQCLEPLSIQLYKTCCVPAQTYGRYSQLKQKRIIHPCQTYLSIILIQTKPHNYTCSKNLKVRTKKIVLHKLLYDFCPHYMQLHYFAHVVKYFVGVVLSHTRMEEKYLSNWKIWF